VFSKKLYRDAVLNSIQISLISSAVGIAAAFFGAKAAHAATGKTKNLFMSILNMTSNFAGIPLAFSFIILLGNAGVLVMLGKSLGIGWLSEFNLYSYHGLLLTYMYFQIPLATLLLMPVFDGLKSEWRESVSLMGGSGFHYWVKVGVPNILPGILGTAGMLFANAIAAYATAYALLAGNYSLLPIRISEQFVGDVVQHKEFGGALAVVLMLLMVAAALLNNAILKRQRWGGTA
jgi:putative spermidine/putrescine transport system permease protein